MSFKDILTTNRKTYTDKDHKVFYRTSTHKYRKGEQDVLTIRIGQVIADNLGWIIGDKLKVMKDENEPRRVALTPSEDGYTTGPAGYTGNPHRKYKDYKGEPGRISLTIRIPEHVDIPRTNQHTIEVLDFMTDVDNEMLILNLPRV